MCELGCFSFAGRLAFDPTCELFEDAGPGAGSIKERAQLLVTFAVALQLAMLQLNKGGSRPFGGEADLDFAGLGHVGVELPIRAVVAGSYMP